MRLWRGACGMLRSQQRTATRLQYVASSGVHGSPMDRISVSVTSPARNRRTYAGSWARPSSFSVARGAWAGSKRF